MIKIMMLKKLEIILWKNMIQLRTVIMNQLTENMPNTFSLKMQLPQILCNFQCILFVLHKYNEYDE